MPRESKHENEPERLAKGLRTHQTRPRPRRARKILYARSLAATPEERWRMNVERCKALGVWGKGLAGKRKLERMVVAGKI